MLLFIFLDILWVVIDIIIVVVAIIAAAVVVRVIAIGAATIAAFAVAAVFAVATATIINADAVIIIAAIIIPIVIIIMYKFIPKPKKYCKNHKKILGKMPTNPTKSNLIKAPKRHRARDPPPIFALGGARGASTSKTKRYNLTLIERNTCYRKRNSGSLR